MLGGEFPETATVNVSRLTFHGLSLPTSWATTPTNRFVSVSRKVGGTGVPVPLAWVLGIRSTPFTVTPQAPDVRLMFTVILLPTVWPKKRASRSEPSTVLTPNISLASVLVAWNAEKLIKPARIRFVEAVPTTRQ